MAPPQKAAELSSSVLRPAGRASWESSDSPLAKVGAAAAEELHNLKTCTVDEDEATARKQSSERKLRHEMAAGLVLRRSLYNC
mmetsp:Transcript_11511/g.20746  ORF Transcript_11511/g.20746 Transcript_11511/m.20746 type:complete len:83 (+) Transcript_11511:443-691(+)